MKVVRRNSRKKRLLIIAMALIAVDVENQMDMTNYGQVDAFCRSAQNGETARGEFFVILDDGGFVRYDMTAVDSVLQVTVSTLKWEDDEPQVYYYHEFTAHSWKYTDKGYLFIEEYRMPGYDGPPGQIGYRVKPLDETCRELNRKYVCPVGYEGNNMLITDWDGQDYSALEFYDLYEILYYSDYGEYVPYEAYEGAQYEVPAAEIEGVIQNYFQIDHNQLVANTTYNEETQSYTYRPRGLEDAQTPYGPYPEVTGYEEQPDGTIKLLVEAVWEAEMVDCAVSGELTVRPLENGEYQYVSNQVVSWDEELGEGWYSPRLTELSSLA